MCNGHADVFLAVARRRFFWKSSHVSLRLQAIQKNCLGRGQEVNGLGFVSS